MPAHSVCRGPGTYNSPYSRHSRGPLGGNPPRSPWSCTPGRNLDEGVSLPISLNQLSSHIAEEWDFHRLGTTLREGTGVCQLQTAVQPPEVHPRLGMWPWRGHCIGEGSFRSRFVELPVRSTPPFGTPPNEEFPRRDSKFGGATRVSAETRVTRGTRDNLVRCPRNCARSSVTTWWRCPDSERETSSNAVFRQSQEIGRSQKRFVPPKIGFGTPINTLKHSDTHRGGCFEVRRTEKWAFRNRNYLQGLKADAGSKPGVALRGPRARPGWPFRPAVRGQRRREPSRSPLWTSPHAPRC